MDLIGLLIVVLVLGVVCWLIIYIIDMLPLPPPFRLIAKVILALIVILVLLSQVGLLDGGLWHRPLRA